MADDPFDLAHWPPVPPNSKPTVETLWSFQRGTRTITCRLLYRGEWGVEAQIFKHGELVIGRRFDTRALAVQWADEERRVLERPEV